MKALMNWIERPTTKVEVLYLPLPDIQAAVKADTGFNLSIVTVKQALKEAGVPFGQRKGPVEYKSDVRNATSVLAKILRGMAAEIGYKMTDRDLRNLTAIVGRDLRQLSFSDEPNG
jgi:hypothetical protein